MTVYSVSYDLNKSGQNYSGLIKELESFDGWCHPMKSYWLICSNLTANQTHELLKKYLDQNDWIIVMEASKNHSGWVLKDACDWINKHI